MTCDVRTGGLREARLYTASCNSKHGLLRIPTDHRRAVLLVLEDSTARKWTNEKIARHCDVSPTLVASVKRSKAELEAARQREADRKDADATGSRPLAAALAPQADCEDPALALALADEDGETSRAIERGIRAIRKAKKLAEVAGLTLADLVRLQEERDAKRELGVW